MESWVCVMNTASIKEKAIQAIEENRQALIQFGRERMDCPELGFMELETAKAVRKKLTQCGVQDLQPVATTGLKGWMYGGENRASVMVLGELDGVISPGHPAANPKTGAAHACGHGAQLAVLAGCALGVQAVKQQLCGNVCFAAAPAEEYIQIGLRQGMRNRGMLAYFGGKQQMIAEGAMDDIDMAMMVHAKTGCPHLEIATQGHASGFIGKEIYFIGKEAHAGAEPWMGVNALNAASLAIQAIHALRETFQEQDGVRVHPILTKGGDLVNTVPADVRMECYVRAASPQAMARVNGQVNRAIRGAAYALGAQVEIQDYAGYYPMEQNAALSRLFTQNIPAIAPAAQVLEGSPFSGSTDMGDVAWMLPAIQPTVSGFQGALHSENFRVTDEDQAFILPAKLMVATIVDLLADGAQKALEIKQSQPRRTKEEYKNLWEDLLQQPAAQEIQ